MRIKWHNLDNFVNKLKLSGVEIREAANIGLLNAGNAIMRKSKEQCPIDTGALVKTGIVTPKLTDEEVYLSYDTPYAVRLHEHPEYKFKNGKKGKYLEDPLKGGSKDLLDGLIASLRGIL